MFSFKPVPTLVMMLLLILSGCGDGEDYTAAIDPEKPSTPDERAEEFMRQVQERDRQRAQNKQPEDWPMPPAATVYKELVEQYGAERVATIDVRWPGNSGKDTYNLGNELRKQFQDLTITQRRSGEEHYSYYFAPVDDLETLAAQLPFGSSKQVLAEQHLIRVVY